MSPNGHELKPEETVLLKDEYGNDTLAKRDHLQIEIRDYLNPGRRNSLVATEFLGEMRRGGAIAV